MKLRATSASIILAALLLAPAAGHGQAVVTNDYPQESLDRGEEGNVRFRVDVTPAGRAKNCVIVQSSGHPRLDQATCEAVVKRARFNPKRDERGNPIEGSYSNVMRWRIP